MPVFRVQVLRGRAGRRALLPARAAGLEHPQQPQLERGNSRAMSQVYGVSGTPRQCPRLLAANGGAEFPGADPESEEKRSPGEAPEQRQRGIGEPVRANWRGGSRCPRTLGARFDPI